MMLVARHCFIYRFSDLRFALHEWNQHDLVDAVNFDSQL
jgi:hypothetical protein